MPKRPSRRRLRLAVPGLLALAATLWLPPPGEALPGCESEAAAAVSKAKPASGPVFPPVAWSAFGINIDPANPQGNPAAAALRDLGACWVRVELRAEFGFDFYDPILAAYRAAGIKALLLVDYDSVPGKPAAEAPDADWLAYLDAFDAGLAAIAGHYGDRVHAWQIWNEPDLLPQPGYDPFVPARHYGRMLLRSVATVRGFSSRPVVTGGLASGNPTYLAQARDAVGSLTVDAVAVHPYGQRPAADWPEPGWGHGDMRDLFDAYLQFGKPLWVTETGVKDPAATYPNDLEGLQADYLERVYQLATGDYAGKVQAVFWFCWSDGMVPPFGVLRADGSQKPSYARYQSVSDCNGGRIAFISDGPSSSDVFVMRGDGAGRLNLTNDSLGELEPAWSPDGSRLAVMTVINNFLHIHVVNADGKNRVDLGTGLDPAWAPDGERLVISANRNDGNLEIYVVDADGGNPVNLTRDPDIDTYPSWSPDGSRIAFVSHRGGGNGDVWVMNADGSNPLRLTNSVEGETHPVWSPDGARIAFVRELDNPASAEIFVMNADGSAAVNVSQSDGPDRYPAWSPDGARLAFMSFRDSNWEIYAMNADGSAPTNLTKSRRVTDLYPSWGR